LQYSRELSNLEYEEKRKSIGYWNYYPIKFGPI
jgi:hypothetical protein